MKYYSAKVSAACFRIKNPSTTEQEKEIIWDLEAWVATLSCYKRENIDEMEPTQIMVGPIIMSCIFLSLYILNK